MKKIKKLLPVLLMSIMSVSAFAEDAVIDGIAYDFINESLEARVARNPGNPYSGDIIIPETVDYNDKTYSVTSIGVNAFYNCKGLKSVVIPNSVTSIDIVAFEDCSGLTSVTIGNSVTTIGYGAFYGCSGLTSVTIPNSVTSIGESAFGGCSALESIIVEEGNTIYDSRENCNAIIETATNTLIAGFKNTVIPNSVTSIGDYAFYECTGLTSVTIPNSVTSIGIVAFEDCSGLTSVTIGNSVTSIGMGAFAGCTGLTSITIPNSVTSIGADAFRHCSGLTSVISLIEEPFGINENTFYNRVEDHDEFTTATLYVPTGTKEKYESTSAWNKFENIVEHSELIDGIKYSFNKETLEAKVVENTYFQYSGDITIPEKVNYKGNTYCVTSIGVNAFYDCKGLKSVVIPNSVTSIGIVAFEDCSGLTSVTIGNSVTKIGDYAFYGCSGLTSVTIPNSVTSIGESVFGGCSALESIIVEEGNTIYDSRENCNAIIETATNTLIVGFKNTVIPNSVTSIGTGAFYGCTGLTEITIPNSVTSIGTGAFGGCSALESIIVEEGNTIYDSRENCNAIIETATNTLIAGCKNTVIPNSVTSIGDYAFYECSGLTSVTIPNSVTSFGRWAFSGCTGLTSVISFIEEPIEITDDVFKNYNEDTHSYDFTSATLYVPAGTKEKYESTSAWNKFENIVEHSELIDGIKYSFNKETLEAEVVENTYFQYSGDITIPEKVNYKGNTYCVTSIGDYAFSYCSGLTSVTIPNSVTSIGMGAFYGCTGLTEITIPNSVTSIGESAFYGCTDLTSVISLIEEPFEINENTFYNSVEDHEEFTTATLYVPAGTKSKYESTPAWNKFKMIVEQEVNAVESAEIDAKAEETERYNVSGQRISTPQKGINIVKMSDGTTRKVVVK